MGVLVSWRCRWWAGSTRAWCRPWRCRARRWTWRWVGSCRYREGRAVAPSPSVREAWALAEVGEAEVVGGGILVLVEVLLVAAALGGLVLPAPAVAGGLVLGAGLRGGAVWRRSGRPVLGERGSGRGRQPGVAPT